MKSILILDDNADLIFLMTTLLRDIGRNCVSARSLRELKDKRSEVLGCSTAILDINLGAGEPSGLDAYMWLREEGYSSKIIFFTGHARSHPLVQEATKLPDVDVIEKPAALADVVALLERVS